MVGLPLQHDITLNNPKANQFGADVNPLRLSASGSSDILHLKLQDAAQTRWQVPEELQSGESRPL